MKLGTGLSLLFLWLIQPSLFAQDLDPLVVPAGDLQTHALLSESSEKVSLASFDESLAKESMPLELSGAAISASEFVDLDFVSAEPSQEFDEQNAEMQSAALLKATSAQNGMRMASLQLFAAMGVVASLVVGVAYFRYRAIERAEHLRENWG